MNDSTYLQINQALFSLCHSYQTRMSKESRGRPDMLSISDRAVLMVLGQFAPMNSRRLSEYMDINPGTISVYVQRLVAGGLIRRERSSEDRRNWLLDLTTNGKTAYRETVEGAVHYTRDFLKALTEEEAIILHALLRKAVNKLGYSWQ